MTDDVIPPEFLEPEGDAERQDPDLVLETTTSTLRSLWREWMCRRGDGTFVDVEFFGRRIGGVPTPAVDAYRALERALRSAGYKPDSRWAYNCRLIADTGQPSLHSAGIAVDIDPEENPYSEGDPFSGKIGPDHVAAALAIRNGDGARVWSWGGHWNKPDRMHFQLDRGPSAVDVDWRTVPGDGHEDDGSDDVVVKKNQKEEQEMVLSKGSKNRAVTRFQECLLAWDAKALPKDGADGVFGKETVEWVGRFQESFGLEKTGVIDGVTAALLIAQGK